MECELCGREKLTKWYYDCDLFWIADCKGCNIPMLIYHRHTMNVPIMDLFLMTKRINKLFGNNVKLRLQARKNKEHFHCHIIFVR